MASDKKHIHLSGICGTAMASLAGLLQLEGHRVTGSDKAAYPPMSDLLRALGIPVKEPYAAENLDPVPDLVVIGNALSRGNPEVERVLDDRIPFASMAALLKEEFLRGREPLVIAGTHGKTTATSMLSWIYQTASKQNPALEPSFLIGGVAENFGSSFQLRPTRTFIVEGDEYDTAFFDKGPKFLHYFPDALILTHVEYDHADIYADLDAVKTAFKRLVNLVPRRSVIVAFDGSPNVTECVSRAFCPVERYGFSAEADWQIRDLAHQDGRTRWQVWRRGSLWSEFEMHLAGEHNALNATAAAALAAHRGIPKDAIAAAIATFKSVKRRLEVRAEIGGVTIIDDFAHHPTAIRETLRALRSVYPQARLWAVLEPRSNTLRRKVLQNDLVESLRLADRVVIAGVYQQQRIAEDERLHPEDVVQALNNLKTPASLCPDVESIMNEILPRLQPGDVVAILSNGGFDGIYEKLPARLRAREHRAGMIASLALLATIVILGAPAAVFLIPWAMVTGNATPLYNATQAITRAAFRLARIRVEVEGRERVPSHTACIFMANHVSNLDPAALIPRIPGRTSAFVKRSLTKIPVFGYGLKLGDFVPVDRDGRVESAVESVAAARRVLKKGFHITTFVEGTRSPDGRLLPFKKGPFYLAMETGAPCVPVSIYGTESMMAKGSVRVRPGTAHIVFHDPLDPKQFAGRDELMAAMRAAIASGLPEWMRT